MRRCGGHATAAGLEGSAGEPKGDLTYEGRRLLRHLDGDYSDVAPRVCGRDRSERVDEIKGPMAAEDVFRF